MYKDEVLAARFTYDARIGLVFRDVLTDALPHALEHPGRSGKVYAGEIGMRIADLANHWTGRVDQVDYTSREACFYQNVHKYSRAVDLCISRLPDHYITAHG